MIVVADTSPINYLLLIGHIDLLPRLYGRVVIPTSVVAELSDADAPAVVKSWIESRPDWIDVSEAVTQTTRSIFWIVGSGMESHLRKRFMPM